MTTHESVLIDTGPLIAFYNQSDHYHRQICQFFDQCHAKLVTTMPCVTEVMWLLSADWRVQNEFVTDLASGLYDAVPLLPLDFARITELNRQYASIPADITSLSLIAVSERLEINAIASFDKEFSHFRQHQRKPFDLLLKIDGEQAPARLRTKRASFTLS